MPEFTTRLKHAWNAFFGRDAPARDLGPSYGSRPDRPRLSRGNARSIVSALYNRIAMDVASVPIRHVRLDDQDRYVDTIHSGLNECLNVEANLDQSGRAFMQDVVMSMLDEGCVAIVPVETDLDPVISGSYDIRSMRVAKVVQWFPKHVRLDIYNENTGQHEQITLPKRMVAVIENPFYAVMNETNSTLQRLQRKLVLLDAVDEMTSSGKLNMIIQLPYVVKSPLRKKQAEARRQEIHDQLSSGDNKLGIAYTDGTEKITQINRPLENNLMDQIEYLTKMLYAQLGLTEEVFNGTASEQQMLDYNNRTLEPILSAITDEMKRKFLTKTARTQHQSIKFFREPFRLTPVNNLADIADRFTRNEILSSNEFRALLGYKPSDDPRADELINKNMPIQDTGAAYQQMPMEDGMPPQEPMPEPEQESQPTGLLDTPISMIMG